jgi:hypothetical protein
MEEEMGLGRIHFMGRICVPKDGGGDGAIKDTFPGKNMCP